MLKSKYNLFTDKYDTAIDGILAHISYDEESAAYKESWDLAAYVRTHLTDLYPEDDLGEAGVGDTEARYAYLEEVMR